MLGGTRIDRSSNETAPDILEQPWPDRADEWISPVARDEDEDAGEVLDARDEQQDEHELDLPQQQRDVEAQDPPQRAGRRPTERSAI